MIWLQKLRFLTFKILCSERVEGQGIPTPLFATLGPAEEKFIQLDLKESLIAA